MLRKAKNMGLLGLAMLGLGLYELGQVSQAQAAKPKPVVKINKEKRVTPAVLNFTLPLNSGSPKPLGEYLGKVLLIVNTASKCGSTPQYEGMQKIYDKYKAQGFEVLAFPSNNFGAQEPGSDLDIKAFCESSYKTSFPLFAKSDVKGPGINPLYAHLTTQSPFVGEIGWNFHKFLVDRQGNVVGRWSNKVKPEAEEITQAIERLLASK